MPIHYLGDLTGKRFTRLVVTGFSHREKKYKKFWNCLCDCGQTKVIYQSYLISKQAQSCGCFQRESRFVHNLKHGMRWTRFYGIWKGINGRCYVPSNHAYLLYGAKGVTSEWKDSFLDFKEDMYESYLQHVKVYGERETTIDRIDNSKGYSKENCRWATYTEQSINRSVTRQIKIGQQTKTLNEWAEFSGLPKTTIQNRWSRGLRGYLLIKPKVGYPRPRPQ